MWFDNDPIEDDPRFGWPDYRVHYIKTLIGSLLQPHINRFQICPWPTRIFGPDAKYPRPHRIFGYTEKRPQTVEPTGIPADYLTLLGNIFQTQGTFETDDFAFEYDFPQTGVFMSDSALFQRRFPDDVKDAYSARYAGTPGFDMLKVINQNYTPDLKTKTGGDLTFTDYVESAAFPHFYGLALPLLKGGLPVRPVQLENITRYPSYLDDYKLLVLSYEFMKPASADVNSVLAGYVRDGGTLCYYGDGGDPFHNVRSWWNSGKAADPTPLEHLLRMLGVPRDAADGVYECGAGKFALHRVSPASICLTARAADDYRQNIESLLGAPLDKNHIILRRGPYEIIAVMDECASSEPVVREGSFVDMLTTGFDVINEKTVAPNEYALLLDLGAFASEGLCVLGSSVRINALNADAEGFCVEARGPDNLRANIRLRLPRKPASVEGSLAPAPESVVKAADGEASIPVAIACSWDEETKTALLSYDSAAGEMIITGSF